MKMVLLIVTMTYCGFAYPQDISQRFTSKTVGDDNVFFIKPHKINALKSNTLNNPLEADFTMASGSDSIAFTFTVYTKELVVLERIRILCYDRIALTSRLEKMFIKTEKNLYAGRYSCKISETNFKNLYSIDLPYVIDLGKGMEFGIKRRKWKTERRVISDIIKLAEINQKH